MDYLFLAKVWFFSGLGTIYLTQFHDYFYSDDYKLPEVFSFDFMMISILFILFGLFGFIVVSIGWLAGNGNFEIITELKIYRKVKTLWKNKLQFTELK